EPRSEDVAFLPLAGGEVLPAGGLVGLDRLGAALRLPDGDLLELFVGELVAELHLPVLDRGGQQAERREPDLVARLHRRLQVVGRVASFLVLGSNDLFSPTPINYLRYFRKRRRVRVGTRGRSEELVEQLTREGWTVLRNDRLELNLDGLAAEVTGLEDAHIV